MGKHSVIVSILLLPLTLLAQELGQLYIEEVAGSDNLRYIVRDPDRSVLVVHSTIRELSFESNGVMYAVDRPYTGIYHVWLHPGTHIITFKSANHLPRKHRFYLPKKNYVEVQVSSDLPSTFPAKISDSGQVPLYGALYINTAPESVRVNLTSLGVYKGMTVTEYTPYYTEQLFPGNYIVELDNVGYQPYRDTLQIKNNKSTRVFIWLHKDEKSIQREIQSIESLIYAKIYTKHNYTRTGPIFLTLAGSTTIFAGLIGAPYVAGAGALLTVAGLIIHKSRNKHEPASNQSELSAKYANFNADMIRSRWYQLHHQLQSIQAHNDSLPPPKIELTNIE